MEWYGVYGNHDYGQFNRQCICGGDDVPGARCAQVQKHGGVHGNQRWHMPQLSYHATPIPGVNLELVALDLNVVDRSKTCPWIACGEKECDDDDFPQGWAAGHTHAALVFRCTD